MKEIEEVLEPELTQIAEALYLAGKTMLQHGQLTAAEKRVKQAISLCSHNSKYLALYVECLFQKKDILRAEKHCEEALGISPGDTELLVLRDRIHANKIPGIFINSLPKSASVFIFNHIRNSLSIPFSRISLDLFANDLAVPDWVETIVSGHGVTQEHLPASRRNLITLRQKGLTKFVVHVRDPRQSLLSWYYHLETFEEKFKMNVFDMDDTPLCLNYLKLSMEEKLDWLIENYQPLQVKWLTDWIDVSKNQSATFDIFFSEFTDLKNDPDKFFKKILDFYSIDHALWVSENYATKSGAFHFRRGEVDEWRSVMNLKQQKRLTELMPDELFTFFNWKV